MTIVRYPADVLRRVCTPVEEFDSALFELGQQLLEAAKDSDGIAVAAPQIGVSLSVFACPFGPDGGVYVNPRIEALSDDQWMFREACLSIPGKAWYIGRPNTVTISYYTMSGQKSAWTESQLLGRMMQHEIDHLHGRLLIDLLTKSERKKFDREWT